MAKVKIIKKEWYPILAPKIFQNAVLGETHVFEPEQMIGKGITQNLMNLTNDIKRQNINIDFKVVDVRNGKAFADVMGYYMIQSSVRRLVRKSIEKIDMSFLCRTSDGKNLRVKPILITRSVTTGSVAARMRKNAQDFLVKYVEAISYNNFVDDLVGHKVQNLLRKDLNKIYPLRVCEIRSMEIIDLEKKGQDENKAKSDKKEKLAAKAESRNDVDKKEEKSKDKHKKLSRESEKLPKEGLEKSKTLQKEKKAEKPKESKDTVKKEAKDTAEKE